MVDARISLLTLSEVRRLMREDPNYQNHLGPMHEANARPRMLAIRRLLDNMVSFR